MPCEHIGCGCEIESGSLDETRYCSEWCAGADQEDEGPCDCGHSECDSLWRATSVR